MTQILEERKQLLIRNSELTQALKEKRLHEDTAAVNCKKRKKCDTGIHPIISLFLSGSLSAGTDSNDVMISALIHSCCGNDICTCGWKICICKALSITLAWEPTAFSVSISMGRGTFCHNLEKVFIFCEDSCGLPVGYVNLLCENNKLNSFRLIWWWRIGLTLHCLWNVDKLITSVQNNKGAFGWVQARCWQLSNFFQAIDNSDKYACGYVIWFHT